MSCHVCPPSGNFAWLNLLTIVLGCAALGDRAVHAVMPFVPVDLHRSAGLPGHAAGRSLRKHGPPRTQRRMKKVGRAGHDPATYGLKVRSSTN